jgi:hypothetical protein
MAQIKNDRRLTIYRLREVLQYDCDDGLFFWKIALSPRGLVGSLAGTICQNGYRMIIIDREPHKASRLAWFYVNGVLPEKYIDHINRIRLDDRISNLRVASPSENSSNIGVTKRSKSGLKGVCKTPWGWQASIGHRGKLQHIGSFRTPEEASSAYIEATKRLNGEFAGF